MISFAEPDISSDDVAAVTRALQSGWITTGEECRALEAELRAYLGAEYVVATSSCTAALEIAVSYLDLPRGARVGVPTWTFVSSALAPLHHGLEPVLLDVEPDTLNLSAEALERALDEGLDAVVGVHFAGVPLAEEIHRLCADRGVPLIEDAAHALGSEDHRGRIAGQGTAGSCFSFYATKNLTSGEGGALATDDAELAAHAETFRLHGLSRDAWARYLPGARGGYDIIGPGIKGNLPDVLAALARSQLVRFDELQRRRRELVEQYRVELARIDGLRLVPAELPAGSADHLMVVLLPAGTDRSTVVARLDDAGIGTSVHFQPLHTFKWFIERETPTGPGGTPVADEAGPRALTLPLHTNLTDRDVQTVCDALAGALQQ